MKNQQSTTRQSNGDLSSLHSPDMESVVLGAIVIETTAFDEVSPILKPQMFYSDRNAAIYAAIQDMRSENKSVDLYTLSQRLMSAGTFTKVGGAAYLAKLTQMIGSAAHITDHARIIAELFVKRELVRIFSSSIGEVFSGDALDVISSVNTSFDKLLDISAGSAVRTGHVARSVAESLRSAEARSERYRKGVTTGITTGLKDLDAKISGWEDGDLIILAARPSMGKTASMLHFCRSAATSGVPVCVFSLEMNEVKLADRLILSGSSVSPRSFRKGKIEGDDWKDLEAAAGNVVKLPMYIDDNPLISVQYIRSSTLRMKKKGLCGMIVIDYLQLINCGKSGFKNREQEISEVSRSLKLLAKELNVPVILLSQLSRDVERRGGNMIPRLSDLRESGSIEQDADIVMFVHRPEYYKIEYVKIKGYEIPTKGYGEFHITKNRNGETGVASFNYNSSMTALYDFDRDFEQEKMPF